MNRKSTLYFCLGVLAVLLLTSCFPDSCSEPAMECAPPEDIPVFDIPNGTSIHWWDGSDFVYVPPGEFSMGDELATSGDNIPAHTVSLTGFWIQKTEVTNRMYAQCVALGICEAPPQTEETPYRFADVAYADHPIVDVTWENARSFCGWIGARLPSEAEWELAAGGNQNEPYPWGDEEPSCQLANYAGCLDPEGTIQVNSYPGGLSPYGLADMAGNVFEWVNDRYGEDYYANSPVQNPPGPETGEKRLIRSSSFLSEPEDLPVTLRSFLETEKTRPDLGFRCVLSEEAFSSPTLPLCTALTYTPIEQQAPNLVPNVQIPPGLSLEVYCKTDNENIQYGTASIVLDPLVSFDLISISSPNGTIFCTPDQNDPQLLNCSGSAFKPGKNVTVGICNLLPPPPVLAEPTCPLDYQFDEATDLCRYGSPVQLPCISPFVDVPGYGCLMPPQNGECPVGDYAGAYNGQPVCIPIGGQECQCAGCPMICPQGLVIDESNICCAYPPDMAPACPLGFSYDSTLKVCAPDTPQEPACNTITAYIPTCGIDACPTCLPEACWVTSTTVTSSGPTFTSIGCVYPCPGGPDSDGPCTP